jgi:hypothetical protein
MMTAGRSAPGGVIPAPCPPTKPRGTGGSDEWAALRSRDKVVRALPASRRGALRAVVASVAGPHAGEGGGGTRLREARQRCGRGDRCCGGAAARGTLPDARWRTRCGDRCIPPPIAAPTTSAGGALCQDGRCVCSPGQRFCHGVCRRSRPAIRRLLRRGRDLLWRGSAGTSRENLRLRSRVLRRADPVRERGVLRPAGQPLPPGRGRERLLRGRCENAVCR